MKSISIALFIVAGLYMPTVSRADDSSSQIPSCSALEKNGHPAKCTAPQADRPATGLPGKSLMNDINLVDPWMFSQRPMAFA
jgi:hypothetical protein